MPPASPHPRAPRPPGRLRRAASSPRTAEVDLSPSVALETSPLIAPTVIAASHRNGYGIFRRRESKRFINGACRASKRNLQTLDCASGSFCNLAPRASSTLKTHISTLKGCATKKPRHLNHARPWRATKKMRASRKLLFLRYFIHCSTPLGGQNSLQKTSNALQPHSLFAATHFWT